MNQARKACIAAGYIALMLSGCGAALGHTDDAQPTRVAPAPTYQTAPVYQTAQVYQPTTTYQPAPVYRPAPTYQPAPVYRQPAPVYQQPTTTYQPAPVYQQPTTTYQPAPVYQQPTTTYQPAPTYQAAQETPRLNPRRSAPEVNQVAVSSPSEPPMQSYGVNRSGATFSNASGGEQLFSMDGLYAALRNPDAPVPPSVDYNIPHLPQEEPLWCWAAAAQQSIAWVNGGRAPAQCAIVAMAHGIDVNECCSDREGVCAKTGEIPDIAKLIAKFGGDAGEITVPRDPESIYKILQQGRTLLIRLRPAPHEQAAGIRHMIVVRGIEWLRMPNGRLDATLLYNDPLGDDQRAVSFDEIEPFFEQALMVWRR